MKRTPSPAADIKMEAMPGQPAPRARRKTCGGGREGREGSGGEEKWWAKKWSRPTTSEGVVACCDEGREFGASLDSKENWQWVSSTWLRFSELYRNTRRSRSQSGLCHGGRRTARYPSSVFRQRSFLLADKLQIPQIQQPPPPPPPEILSTPILKLKYLGCCMTWWY